MLRLYIKGKNEIEVLVIFKVRSVNPKFQILFQNKN